MPNKDKNHHYLDSYPLSLPLEVDNNYLFLPKYVPYLLPISGLTPEQLLERFSMISHYHQNVLNTLSPVHITIRAFDLNISNLNIDKPKSKPKVPKSESYGKNLSNTHSNECPQIQTTYIKNGDLEFENFPGLLSNE